MIMARCPPNPYHHPHLVVVVFVLGIARLHSFSVAPAYSTFGSTSGTSHVVGVSPCGQGRRPWFSSTPSSDSDENDKDINPYADPNYPDLEFVNYDDPEYSAARQDDEYFDSSSNGNSSTDEQIEAMREERRRRNDEYQFQTYWTSIWGAGDVEYKGEWTVYYSNTFFPEVDDNASGKDALESENEDSLPRLIQASEAPLSVISRARKEVVSSSSSSSFNAGTAVYPVDRERIRHHERLEQPMGDADLAAAGTDEVEQLVLQQTYWPDQLAAKDFRGPPGIMVCGNAWTICTAVPLLPDSADSTIGPFREYRVELGIQADDVRFRVKFDYGIVTDSTKSKDDEPTVPPPLHLKTMTVCREAANQWPRSSALANSLFSYQEGAIGGLYDPPPIPEDVSSQYCMVDMEGGATALFPIVIDQSVENTADDSLDSDKLSWIASLDWTAGPMRYQVDRKSYGGVNIRSLRTLELSEVQGADVEQYRPRDGGQDMRQ